MSTNGTKEIAAAIANAEDAAHLTGIKAMDVLDFLKLKIPPREFVLEPILREKDLAMIFSWRGVGKTFLALHIGWTIAAGTKILGWTAPRPRRVVYTDGEMPAGTMQERLSLIRAGSELQSPEPEYFRIITPDTQDAPMPNFLLRESQDLADQILSAADVVVFDSISTLFRGGRENEAESWLPVQEWLVQLRRRGITVIFLHHEGKGGTQRGTSRREDVLDQVIHLVRPTDYQASEGARFELHFEKARGTFGDSVNPLEAKLEIREGRAEWSVRNLEDVKLKRVVELFKLGLTIREMGEELKVSKSQAQRLGAKARRLGLVPNE